MSARAAQRFAVDERVARLTRDENYYNRRGRVFTLRLEEAEEKLLRERMNALGYHGAYGHDGAPGYASYRFGRRTGSLGGFIVWAALKGSAPAGEKPEPKVSAQAARNIAKASKKARR